MPFTKSSLIKIIFSSIDEINEALTDGRKGGKSLDLILYGANSEVDSLSFVGLIVSIEDSISADYGADIDIIKLIEDEEDELDTLESLINMLLKNIK